MNETIKQFKIDLLNNLKAQKQSIEAQKDAFYQQKFSEKKIAVDEAYVKLDNAFAQYRQDKFASCNADIAKKEEEVKAKKAKLLEDAKQSALCEVESEIAMMVAEFNSEIAKLEKELA